ncbi:hypothetical protein PMAYCL1PPCAC_19000, partial [Pristionchus mayeri]
SLQDSVMSCAMSSSLYGGLLLYRSPAEEEPTAAELLEATKRLYVKTDALKERKIDACTPRLFPSPAAYEDGHAAPRRPRVVAVAPSGSGFRPSANSAFRPIVKEVAAVADDVIPEVGEDVAAPARPPKSTRIIQRARRLHQESICPISGQHRGSPPPLPPMRNHGADRSSVGYELARRKSAPVTELTRPVPAPRLSKLSTASSNSQPTPLPQPLPRRRTIQMDGSIIRVEDMSKSSPDLISPRLLSPNSSRHSPCLPSTLIRKRMAPSLVRPATPLPSHEGVTLAPNREQRPPTSPQGHSSHGVHGRRMTQTLLTLPSGSMPLSSPTSTGKATSKDSGVQPSDEEEDYKKQASSLSEEVDVMAEEDDDSVFTSITNQPRREETVCVSEEPSVLSSALSRPLSVIEKHTRIITWIKSSATVPPEDDLHHSLHHNELTV